MAIQFVGAVSAATTGSEGSLTLDLTALTGGIAAAVAANDRVIVVHSVAASTLTYFIVESPSAYETLYVATPNTAIGLGIYQKTLTNDSADLAAVTVNTTGSGIRGTVAIAYVFRGVSADLLPFITTAYANESGKPDSPSITTPCDDCVVLSVGAVRSDSTPQYLTAPTGYGNAVQIYNSSFYNVLAVAAFKTVSAAGAEDPDAWTGGEAKIGWAAASIFLAPFTGIVNRSTVAAVFGSGGPGVIERSTVAAVFGDAPGDPSTVHPQMFIIN